MQFIRTFDQIEIGDRGLVGGKALSLARLARAGFAVPQAFCITTPAHQSWIDHGRHIEHRLAEEILAAHASLSAAKVAIRSSLVVEDGTLTSLAGLTLTRIGKFSGNELLEVVEQLWAQADSGIVCDYLREVGLPNHAMAVAVIIQALVPADVAGVLMTRDPLEPARRCFLVEAAWGLGESVASGEVVPDRYWLDPASGEIVDQRTGFKPSRRTVQGRETVPEPMQQASCLSSADLTELASCGRSVADLFGYDCDIEWTRTANKLWVLQARPITTSSRAEQAQLRREEIEQARAKSEPGGTIWIQNAFAQELPEPTPMTWSVLKRMLSARGGYGLLYRDLGFHPDPGLDESGSYDLISGRLYSNLSREPLFYADGLPLIYDPASFRRPGHPTIEPRPKLELARAGPRFWFRLPWHLYRAIALPRRLRRICRDFPVRFRAEILPRFRRQLESTKNIDWSQYDQNQLLGALHEWIDIVFCDYAREALKAGVLASHTESSIKNRLRKTLSADETRACMTELAGDIQLDIEIDLAGSLRALANGELDRQTFLSRFGHRCGGEWELARPRWSEATDDIENLTSAAQTAPKRLPPRTEIPRALPGDVNVFKQLLRLRELAKHYLLDGYAIIRKILLEWDRRNGLDGGCFYLSLDELDQRLSDAELKRTSARNKRRRRLLLAMPAPATLDSGDLEAIGRPAPMQTSTEWTLHGIPLSPGVAEGIAFIPKDPRRDKAPSGPFVLVCRCTDPAWIPLASQARGLVTETGGLLSHGAILARELGLPAVGGVADVSNRLARGSVVRVDGLRGLVTIFP